MNETYQSPLSKPRKVAQTVNDAVVITTTVVAVYGLCHLAKDLVEDQIDRHRERKTRKNK